MLNIAVFASGSGTNAENLIRYFSGNSKMRIALIVTNKANAGVISRAQSLSIPTELFSKEQCLNGNDILKCLSDYSIDAIILAGYLLLMPENIIQKYTNRIINIHPALLPAHGGKGFFGSNVHEAVINTKAIMSGITVHKVNEKFDEGKIIFQAACYVTKDETPDSLSAKIHELEYAYYPVVAEKYFRDLK